MTHQETFKRRIRERMAKTGERYTAARKSLISEPDETTRAWVAEPEFSNERVFDATGRDWDEWCDIIDASPVADDGHTAIAAYLQTQHGVDSWWSQSVTVGYERITGARLPHQRADGTFTAGKSRTMVIDVDLLRSMLVSDVDRRDLFPGLETTLRSKPTAKSLRVGMEEGVILVSIDPVDHDRVRVTITHEKLPSPAAVEQWKTYWNDWLAALAEG